MLIWCDFFLSHCKLENHGRCRNEKQSCSLYWSHEVRRHTARYSHWRIPLLRPVFFSKVSPPKMYRTSQGSTTNWGSSLQHVLEFIERCKTNTHKWNAKWKKLLAFPSAWPNLWNNTRENQTFGKNRNVIIWLEPVGRNKTTFLSNSRILLRKRNILFLILYTKVNSNRSVYLKGMCGSEGSKL